MPRPPPVISATLPSSRPTIASPDQMPPGILLAARVRVKARLSCSDGYSGRITPILSSTLPYSRVSPVCTRAKAWRARS